MRTSTLQVRNFPESVNSALKKKAVDQGMSLGQLVISILADAAKRKRRMPHQNAPIKPTVSTLAT